MDTLENNDVGEVVSALWRFSPDALKSIELRYPGNELVFRRGAVLGSAPTAIGCELALEMLTKYGDAVTQIQKRVRRRLTLGWWFDLIAKLVAMIGASGSLVAFLGTISHTNGIMSAILAIIGGGGGLAFSALQRDESGNSLPSAYNRLIQALVDADQQERLLRSLCPDGKGTELKHALERANQLGRILNEFSLRYG